MADGGGDVGARVALLRCAAAFGHHTTDRNTGGSPLARHSIGALPVKQPPPGLPGHLSDPIGTFDATQERRQPTPQRCQGSRALEYTVGGLPARPCNSPQKKLHWDADDDDIDDDAMVEACSTVEMSAAHSVPMNFASSPHMPVSRPQSLMVERRQQVQAEHPASSSSHGRLAEPQTAQLFSESNGQHCDSSSRVRSRSRSRAQQEDGGVHETVRALPSCTQPLPPASDVSCGPFLRHCGAFMLPDFERISSWQDGVQLLQRVLPQSRFPAQLVAANADVHWQHSVHKVLSPSQKALLAQVPESIKFALLQLLLVCPKMYEQLDSVLADVVECWPIIHAYASLRLSLNAGWKTANLLVISLCGGMRTPVMAMHRALKLLSTALHNQHIILNVLEVWDYCLLYTSDAADE